MRRFSLGRNLAHVCDYADMVKVAVHIAVKQTLLAPHFLYEGADNALTDWLRKREIPIIRCRTRLFGRLREISQRKQDPQILAIGAGAFLRTELPRIALEMGMEDEYILYTDCDVMFMDQLTEDLEKLSCRYFAVAPEFDSKDYQLMNTGVMLMNLKNLIAVEEKFRKFFWFQTWKSFRAGTNRHINGFTKDREEISFLGADGIAFPFRLIGNPTGRLFKGQNRTLTWSQTFSKAIS
jgi:hypothetical protein